MSLLGPDARFGADLRLLHDLGSGRGRDRGSDLQTSSDKATGQVDLATVAGVDDLRQALLLRLLTPAGELAQLGHPTYGSRLYELIGELNSDGNRNRAKVFVLQALADEPRIASVRSVSVTPDPSIREQIRIVVSAVAIQSDTLVNLVFPFFLGGGPAAPRATP